MTRIYQFIATETAAGNTVLVYRRMSPVKHLKDMSRVSLVDDVVYVDGVSVKGWTIVRKP